MMGVMGRGKVGRNQRDRCKICGIDEIDEMI